MSNSWSEVKANTKWIIMRLDDIVWRSKNHNYHGKVFQNKSTFDSEAKKDSEVYKHEKNILDLNKINSTYSWYLR